MTGAADSNSNVSKNIQFEQKKNTINFFIFKKM